MKINIVSDKNSRQANEVKNVVKKLFPNAEVSIKSRFTESDARDCFTLVTSDVYDKTKSVMARKILDCLDLGVSEKTLKGINYDE